VDAVVCTLALSYVKDLRPVFAEFARVLRPGGHLVVSDAHVALAAVRPVPSYVVGTPEHGTEPLVGILPEYHRQLSYYLAAALPLGLQVKRCEELQRSRLAKPDDVPPADPDDVPSAEPDERPAATVSWEILFRCPEATAVAFDVPSVVVWHFQLAPAAR